MFCQSHVTTDHRRCLSGGDTNHTVGFRLVSRSRSFGLGYGSAALLCYWLPANRLTIHQTATEPPSGLIAIYCTPKPLSEPSVYQTCPGKLKDGVPLYCNSTRDSMVTVNGLLKLHDIDCYCWYTVVLPIVRNQGSRSRRQRSMGERLPSSPPI